MRNLRTSVVLDGDVAAEVERLQGNGLGASEALNLLARRGIGVQTDSRYRHRTARIGMKVDVTKVADVLDLLDESPR